MHSQKNIKLAYVYLRVPYHSYIQLKLLP